MLRTRLWMGAVLIALAVGMLVFDQRWMPWAPFLFVFVVGLGSLACIEMVALLGPGRGVHALLCFGGVLALGLANWLPHLTPLTGTALDPWPVVLGTFAGLVLAVFLVEMATFREPGGSVERMARTLWVIAYLGLLPSFFAQLRWLCSNPNVGTAAL